MALLNRKLPQGQKVNFSVGNNTGVGEICGIAQTYMPPIGCTYIIKIKTSNINKSEYAYTHIVANEMQIEID